MEEQGDAIVGVAGSALCPLPTPRQCNTPFSASGGGRKVKRKAGEARACDQDVRKLCDKCHVGVCEGPRCAAAEHQLTPERPDPPSTALLPRRCSELSIIAAFTSKRSWTRTSSVSVSPGQGTGLGMPGWAQHRELHGETGRNGVKWGEMGETQPGG